MEINPEDLLLICFLLGFTKRRGLHPSEIGITIPWWSIAGPNNSTSCQRRIDILQKSSFTILLVIRFLTNQHHRRGHRSFCSLFRRIFKTGPRPDRVAHMGFTPTIYDNLFVSNTNTTICRGIQITDCNFVKAHPTLPLVVSVMYDHRNRKSSMTFKVLSKDGMQVVYENSFEQPDFQPNLTWHESFPFVATCAGRLPDTLDLHRFSDTKLSTYVNVYQVDLDGRCFTQCAILVGHECPVTAVAFCPNNPFRVVTGDILAGVQIWDIRECKSVYKIKPVFDFKCQFYSEHSISSIIWMSPQEIVVINLIEDMILVQISPEEDKFESRSLKNQLPKSLLIFPQNLVCMAPHPSGRFFVTYSLSTLILWDASFERKTTLTLDCKVYSLRFNRLGNLLIVGSAKNLMIVGVSPNGNQMRVLASNEVHNRYISDIVVHTDGNKTWILSVDINGSLVSSQLVKIFPNPTTK
jgi:WD40 repeat protein